MKKILTTVAGLLTFAMIGTACSAVDTKEATSATPASVSTSRPENFQDEVREFKTSRDAARPVVTPKPVVPMVTSTISYHENHVNHMQLVKAAKELKAQKAKMAKVKKVTKKIVKPKKVYKKTYKVKKKAPKKVKATKVRLSGIAACIAKYESGGNPRAQNPSSSASGLYQFIDGTWNNYGGYSRAMYAPVSVQTAKFYQVWDGGRGAHHWVVRHKCGY